MIMENGIFFPGIHAFFGNIPSGFTIFGFEIKIYAIMVFIGFVLAYKIAQFIGKKEGISDELYLDFFLAMVIPSIVGARLYYILFRLPNYTSGTFGENLLAMVNIRQGGLAVYGGLIAGTITAFIFCKVKKISAGRFADTIFPGVLIGQMLGRWGNFFNREAFGGFTKSFLRMAIPVNYFDKQGTLAYYLDEGIITNDMLTNMEQVKEQACITVWPTFLLEGMCCLTAFIILMLYRKHKKFDGEITLLYAMFYGLGRFGVEALRTDSLMAGSLKISQVLAAVCVAVSLGLIIYIRISGKGRLDTAPILSPDNASRGGKVEDESPEDKSDDASGGNEVEDESPEDKPDNVSGGTQSHK